METTMLLLNKTAVKESLSHADCINVLIDTMQSVSSSDVIMPLRQFMEIPNTAGKFTVMPGYVANPASFGVKIVSKFPRESGSPHGTHVGAMMLFDAEQGTPLALLHGGELTAIRTAAASGLATRRLARDNAETLTLLGCGEQAQHHLKAMLAVRSLKKVIVWGRSVERAQAFAEAVNLPTSTQIYVETDIKTAVAAADIICTVTSATKPILKGEWVTPGTHINLVGAAMRTSAEADTELVKRSRFYIDYRTSAMSQAGELLDAIEQGSVSEAHIIGEIGEVLAKQKPGRESAADITVYKSLGVAAQDLAAASCAFNNALKLDKGVSIDWQ
jgi:ornithine cyclodeaminase/alanine dehydrogenase-like protein (mu-crystallin family)